MRFATTTLILLAVLLASLVCAVALGAVHFGLPETWHMLTTSAGAAWQRTILLGVRLPRALVAAIAGGGLALSGGAMQGVFRNSMADPGIVGVSGGAALGAVMALYLGVEGSSTLLVPGAAFLGAVGCAWIVYRIASSRGRTRTPTLLLAGVAVGGVAAALTTFVLSLSLANWEVGRQMTSWLMGGLEGRGWTHVAMISPPVLVGTLGLFVYSRALNVLSTGEESALSLGLDVPVVKRNVIVLASLVTAATVAVMGVVSFVGLMVPHIVRLVVGPDHRRLFVTSFLTGAIFLVWADTACRVISAHHDLRLGVITAMVGGPFFLYLVIRKQREGAL